MNIVLLVFGTDLKYHIETNFCLLTIIANINKSDTITVYTDHPEYYARIAKYIDIVVLKQQTLESWINNSGYIFRAKIKAIEHSVQHHPNQDLLFLDCDTALYQPLNEIRNILNSGKGIMCNDEGHPSKMQGPSLRMWKALDGKTIAGCTFSAKHNVWNSGVIGIPQAKLSVVINLAIKVCDFILNTNVKCFTAEQYAFSVAMQENIENMSSSQPWICHYWGNKNGWHKYIKHFFLTSFFTNRSIEDEIQAVANNKDYCNLPIHVKVSNTKRRLIKLLNRLFPDRMTKIQ